MSTNLITIFLTGLLTGGLTCLAVQGGLLATTIAQQEEERVRLGLGKKGSAMAIIYFLIAKLAAYTALGFLLGSLGSVMQLSLAAKLILQYAVIIFMLGTAGNLLNIHPIFRYFIIQPPKFITKKIRNQAKSESIFAPAILGAFTVFIPCGTTQAMMALAIATGSAFGGGAVMFSFILGTTPLFFVLGYFMTRLGDAMQKKFFKVAAFAIIFLALYSLNGALALSGAPNFTSIYEKISAPAYFVEQLPGTDGSTSPVVNNSPTVTINSYGYSPRILYVEAGKPVSIKLVNDGGYGCQQAFNIPSLRLQKIVPPNGTETLSFTAPSEPQELQFMCSMGMYRGTIVVQKPSA